MPTLTLTETDPKLQLQHAWDCLNAVEQAQSLIRCLFARAHMNDRRLANLDGDDAACYLPRHVAATAQSIVLMLDAVVDHRLPADVTEAAVRQISWHDLRRLWSVLGRWESQLRDRAYEMRCELFPS